MFPNNMHTEKMKSLFLVKSPLQLLNAVEARHHFSLKKEECVLVVMSDRKNYPQMIKLINEQQQWCDVIVLDKVSVFIRRDNISKYNKIHSANMPFSEIQKSSFFALIKLIKLAKIYKDVNYLFVGDSHNAVIRGFINKSTPKKTVLLDDGVGAIYMAGIRKQRHKDVPNIKLKKKIKIWLKRFFQGLDDRQSDSVCFFSAYNLDVADRDDLVLNEYHYLRSKIDALKSTDYVLFLGSPLSEVGLMSESDYIRQLKMVCKDYEGTKIIYVSHRRENKQKLDLINIIENIEVVSFDYPIEYQLTVYGPLPKSVISFVTSALENLRLIMGNKLEIVSYKLVKGSYKDSDRIDDIYDYFQKNTSPCFSVRSLGVRNDNL